MSLWHALRAGTRSLFRKRQVEQDLDDELQHFLEQITQENLRAGMTREAAQRAARLQVGGFEATRARVRARGGLARLAASYEQVDGDVTLAEMELLAGASDSSVAQDVFLCITPLPSPRGAKPDEHDDWPDQLRDMYLAWATRKGYDAEAINDGGNPVIALRGPSLARMLRGEEGVHKLQREEAQAEPKQAANWTVAELFGALNRLGKSIDECPISPVEAAELLKLVADGTISGTIAKQVFEIMLETGDAPGRIVEERGLKQTSDTGAIDAEIDRILAANADKVAEYKGGKQQLFGFFVGQTMKAMAGKANPQIVNERLRAKLG